jgi:hypothetical protein
MEILLLNIHIQEKHHKLQESIDGKL